LDLLAGWLSAAPLNPDAHTQSAVWHAWATRAHLLGSLNRWAEAAAQLQMLQQVLPAHAAHHFNAGFAWQQLSEWSRAEQAFRQALALSPRMDLAWFGLGDVLYQQGRHTEAEAAWTRQTELQPLCADGLERLVQLHAALGQSQQASQRLGQLRAFAPRQAMALEPVVAQLSGVRQ
jgi:tetratricopeptide (TPR) repeat protein